jgi:hypothetical protein
LNFKERLFNIFLLKAVMDNGPARKNKIAQKLQMVGEEIGDPFEISTVRREVRFVSIYSL